VRLSLGLGVFIEFWVGGGGFMAVLGRGFASMWIGWVGWGAWRRWVGGGLFGGRV